MDILLVCISFKLIPFIRYEVTFRYLSIVMHTFKDDKPLKEMIEKTIIFYVLYLVIDRKKIFSFEFTEYCKKLSGENLLNNIIARKENNNIDFIEDGVKEIKAIIIDEINKLFV